MRVKITLMMIRRIKAKVVEAKAEVFEVREDEVVEIVVAVEDEFAHDEYM